MKKLYNLTLQTLVCVLLTISTNATTIHVNYTSTDTVRACDSSFFNATFTLPAGSYHIIIKDSVNLDTCANSACSIAEFATLHITEPDTIGDFTWNAAINSWSIDLIGGTYNIRYRVRLDCSVIPACDSVITSLNFYQKWSDTAGDFFNIDSSGTNERSSHVLYPYFIDQTASQFYANYLDTLPIYHIYLNTGIKGNIQFTFGASPSNACTSDTLLSVKYAVGNPSNPSLLLYIDTVFPGWNDATVDSSQALVVRKNVLIRSCIDAMCGSENDTLVYRCRYADTIFCKQCQREFDQTYAIKPNEASALSIIRIFPASSLDTACMGTVTKYRYKIKNTGSVNFKDALISLSGISLPKQLLLINSDSIYITPYLSSNSTWHDTIYINPNALCHDSSQVLNSLSSMNIYIKNFMKNDSLLLDFQTFKCCEENDVLFSTGVLYGTWNIEATGYDSCGNAGVDVKKDLNNTYGWNMNLDYVPTVSNLTVPHDSVFGPSTELLFMDVTSPASVDSDYYQLFGCTGNPASCTMQGFLRVHINTKVGLFVDTPAVYLKNFPLDPPHLWKPVYYYSTHNSTQCDSSDAYYYWDLSDTNAYALLKKSRLYFRLRSCCGSPMPGETPYTIDFALLANPNGNCYTIGFTDTTHTQPPNCTDCCFLFQTETSDHIGVRCPNCRAVGPEVNSYSIKRINLGLQDSTNSGRASVPITAIDTGYLSTYETLMRIAAANHNDLVEDLMSGHFQDGDPTIHPDPGYNYQQMLNDSGILHFLQLDRTFTLEDGVTNMKPTPYYFKLYVDIHDSLISDSCIDCAEYGVSSNYRTIHIIEVPDSEMIKYVQYNPARFRVLFTFDATSPDTSHNMFKNVIWDDPAHPFTGYFPGQRYRMKTDYQIKGFFSPPDPFSQTDIQKQQKADIINTLFLSGMKHDANVLDTVPSMPNDSSELATHGDTIPPVFSQPFANHYMFFCARGEGRFRFYADEPVSYSGYTEAANNACQKQISFETYILTGGLDYVGLYPYEFKISSLKPDRLSAHIPTGYTIDTVATITSGYFTPFLSYGTPKTFTVHPVSDSVIVNVDSLLTVFGLYCLPDTVFSVTTTSNLYSADNRLDIKVVIQLNSANCDTNAFYIPRDSDIVATFQDNYVSCLDSITIYSDTLRISLPRGKGDTLQTPKPSLSFYFTPDSITAYKHKLCWNFTLSNSNDDAYNVFIAPQQTGWLTNWEIDDSAGTTLLTSNSFGIIDYNNHLSKTYFVDTLYLCATYDSCAGSATIPVSYGWNCSGYPQTLDSTICSLDTVSVSFNDALFSPSLHQNSPDTIDLCQPFIITDSLTNADLGSIYPFELYLDTLPPYLSIISVQLTSSCPFAHDTVTIIGSPPYSITDTVLAMIGINEDTTIQYGGACLIVLLNAEAECAAAFIAGDTINLPHVHIKVHTFCDSILDISQRVTAFPPLQFQAIYSGVSHCTNCFTLTKTALQDTVAVGDTATFQIIICGNNADTEIVNLTEYLPANFDTLSGSVIPATDTLYGQQCDTILVSGIFNTSGSCPDSAFTNTIQISNAFVDTTASACMTVVQPLSPCIALADTVIADSSFTSSFGFNSFNNDTVFIAGRLYVNTPLFTFNSCLVYMGTGAQIIVMPSDTLKVIYTIISGCTNMWRGIFLDSTAVYYQYKGSYLHDANWGVYASDKSKFIIRGQGGIMDCVRGIYVPPNISGGSNSTYGEVTATQFGLYAPALKPNYNLQPPHGILPYAGMDLNDMQIIIGDNLQQQNEFYHLNNGVVARRSRIVINNSEFTNVRVDTFYVDRFRGTAMVSVGKFGSVFGDLRVNPVASGLSTVDNSNRGIFTDFSKLYVNGVIFTKMNTGIYSDSCSLNTLTSYVGFCTIEASRYGIRWENNTGTGGMNAEFNTITVTRSRRAGIALTEKSNGNSVIYNIYSNIIYTDSTINGIHALNIFKPNITLNQIHLSGVPDTLYSKGINLDGCYGGQVSCNSVTGEYPSVQHQSRGIVTSITNSCTISCNSVDSTYYGFLFGGVCSSTAFIGNAMNKHYAGLYLNKVAVIGEQPISSTPPYNGNTWLDSANYLSHYGAVNMNDSNLFNLTASLFTTNQTLAIHNPIIPNGTQAVFDSANDVGWFLLQNSGSTFDCRNSNTCGDDQRSHGSDEMKKNIARDSTITSDFIPESKMIAKQDLYSELKKDSATLASDTIYQNFVNAKQYESVGYLYEAKESFKKINIPNDSTKNVLSAIDSTIKFYSDSVNIIDSIAKIDTVTNYSPIRENLIAEINNVQQSSENLMQQQQVKDSTNLAMAETKNNNVSPQENPDANEKFMNEMDILYQKGGIDAIQPHYEEILAIASQCPYLGGTAVYKARPYVEMFNDSVEYNDDDVCEQQGIYRIAQSKHNTDIANQIKIIPNPADKEVDILLRNQEDGICKIDIKDALGKTVLTESFNCNENKHTIFTGNFQPGVYFIQVKINMNNAIDTKLIIMR